jgi:mannose-1-phosphate guanylyltransferase
MNDNFTPSSKTVAVIMAGGSGKRLWPLSTKDRPKQISTVFSKKTMLKEAYDRVVPIFGKDNVLVVTTQILAEDIKKILKISNKNLLIQPKNADTAIAMCIAAVYLDVVFPDSVAVYSYSDHYIDNPEHFMNSIRSAVRYAEKYDQPLIIGTLPTAPNTQFGYVGLGDVVDKSHNLYKVKSFYEKPDLETARKFLESGQYVWNTGLKVWSTKSLINSIKTIIPNFYKNMVEIRSEVGSEDYAKIVDKWFDNVQPESFEKLVSEKLNDAIVFIADYRWKDIGTWKTIYEVSPKDEFGNAIIKKDDSQIVKAINTKNSLIIPHQNKVVVVGVSDVVIIQSEDTLYISSKEMTESIKNYIIEDSEK